MYWRDHLWILVTVWFRISTLTYSTSFFVKHNSSWVNWTTIKSNTCIQCICLSFFQGDETVICTFIFACHSFRVMRLLYVHLYLLVILSGWWDCYIYMCICLSFFQGDETVICTCVFACHSFRVMRLLYVQLFIKGKKLYWLCRDVHQE